jgi:DNA-directed RNA polymerase subunit RPC12/RpoP
MTRYTGNHCPVCEQAFTDEDDIVVCPDCGKHISVFGNSHVDEVAAKHHLPVLAKCPIDPQLAALSDAGMIETYGGQFLEGAADACEKLLK